MAEPFYRSVLFAQRCGHKHETQADAELCLAKRISRDVSSWQEQKELRQLMRELPGLLIEHYDEQGRAERWHPKN